MIGFLPFILIIWQLEELSEAMTWGLLALGFCYVPIGLMIAAMDELSKALNPMVLLSCIRRAGSGYVVLIITFGLFTIGNSFIEDAFAGSWIFSSVIAAYGIMFTARLIGCVYRDRLANDDEEQVEPDALD